MEEFSGYTLIELLFTLAVLGILAVFGLASFNGLIQKNEQQTIYDEIKTIVAFAKIKALESEQPVYLGPLDPKLDWSKGILLTQFNKKTSKEKSIHQWQWQHPHWELTWSGFHSSKQIPFSNNPSNARSNGQFVLKNSQTGEKLIILLNRLGRVRSTNE